MLFVFTTPSRLFRLLYPPSPPPNLTLAMEAVGRWELLQSQAVCRSDTVVGLVLARASSPSVTVTRPPTDPKTDEFGRTLYRDSDAQIGEAVARSLPWRPSSQDAQLSTVQVGAGSQFGRGTFGA